MLLARELTRLGAKVTLALGPVEGCCIEKTIKVIRFKFFDELKDIVTRELKNKAYDLLIHSAAVSDYKPAKAYPGKIASGRKRWNLVLVPTIKIIDEIRKADTSLFLAGFKYEPDGSRERLLRRARDLMERSGLELVVANSSCRGGYQAYILGKNGVFGPFKGKRVLAQALIKRIEKEYGGSCNG